MSKINHKFTAYEVTQATEVCIDVHTAIQGLKGNVIGQIGSF
jgi:hypothetical protein